MAMPGPGFMLEGPERVLPVDVVDRVLDLDARVQEPLRTLLGQLARAQRTQPVGRLCFA